MEITKFIEYFPIIKEDKDFDFAFLLYLIKYKLQRMSKYFHTHNIVENENELGNICDKLVNILNAGYLSDTVTCWDLGNIKVNIKNVNRFMTDKEQEISKSIGHGEYYAVEVRQRKAKKLFWKYLEHKIEILWD